MLKNLYSDLIIMLLDYNYKKIADLAALENVFWANIKVETNKMFLSLDWVDYIDIDNDGIMEIIIGLPTYEGIGEDVGIIKYSDGKVVGANIQASVQP